MADFDPDAYLSGGDGSSAAFDPDAYLGNTKPSLVEAATKPITDIPSVYSDTVNQSVSQMGRGVGQLESGDPWTMTKGAGNVALGGLGYVTAPINAPLQSIVGNPVRDAASYAGLSPTASQLAGNLATAGAGFFLPLPGAGTLARTAKLPEVDPAFGLPLTAGEAAQSPAMVRAEQQAIRQGKQYAADFSADRTQRLGDVQEQVTGGMGPSGWKPPATPQQAGETVSARVQQAAATKKAAVTEYYNVAKAFPGEIDAGVYLAWKCLRNVIIFRDGGLLGCCRLLHASGNRFSGLLRSGRRLPAGWPHSPGDLFLHISKPLCPICRKVGSILLALPNGLLLCANHSGTLRGLACGQGQAKCRINLWQFGGSG